MTSKQEKLITEFDDSLVRTSKLLFVFNCKIALAYFESELKMDISFDEKDYDDAKAHCIANIGNSNLYYEDVLAQILMSNKKLYLVNSVNKNVECILDFNRLIDYTMNMENCEIEYYEMGLRDIDISYSYLYDLFFK